MCVFVCEKVCACIVMADNCVKKSTLVFCTAIYKCVEECQVCVLLEVYANDSDMQMNVLIWMLITQYG